MRPPAASLSADLAGRGGTGGGGIDAADMVAFDGCTYRSRKWLGGNFRGSEGGSNSAVVVSLFWYLWGGFFLSKLRKEKKDCESL